MYQYAVTATNAILGYFKDKNSSQIHDNSTVVQAQ